MLQQDQDIHSEARRAHEHIYMRLLELKRLQSEKPDIEALTDSVYALKEAEAALKDVAREVKKLYNLFERLACMGWSMKGDLEPIRTKHCTGSPDLKQTVITPKAGTPEYEEFRKHFGVPEGIPFRPHWPSMLEAITEDVKAGRPLPPGCDPSKMMTEYRVTIRNKKGVEEGQVSDPELLKKQYEVFSCLTTIDTSSLKKIVLTALELKELQDLQSVKNNESDTDSNIKPESDSDEENPF